MKRTLILLYILLILTMATATVVEKFMGTDYVSSRIYGAWWFSLLWGILTALGVLYIVRSRMRQWNIVALHLSFVVILAGALLTHLTSFRGTMPLRVGQTTDRYYRTDGETGMPSHRLPFRIRLDGFRIRYHAGTKAAADYESRVTVMDGNDRQPAIVSMNHIMTHRGVRFYQSSYDADMRGSTLAINSDLYGIPVTYTGYALLFFSLIALLMRRDGTFRTLLRHPLLRKGMLVSVLWLCMLDVNATTTFPKDVADRFGHLHILYQDRVCPTVASALATLSLPCTRCPRFRYLYRGNMGERFMGAVLELGPERNVGAYHVHGLRRRRAQTKFALAGAAARLPYLYDPRFPHDSHDLFRGQLFLGRHACLRVRLSIPLKNEGFILWYLPFQLPLQTE